MNNDRLLGYLAEFREEDGEIHVVPHDGVWKATVLLRTSGVSVSSVSPSPADALELALDGALGG